MRVIRFIALLALPVLFVTACKKKTQKGNVVLTIMYDGKAVKGADIYMKQGARERPQIALSQYDQKVAADGLGQAIFTDLPEDFYYFYSTAPIAVGTGTGEIIVDVAVKEQLNRYEKKIVLE